MRRPGGRGPLPGRYQIADKVRYVSHHRPGAGPRPQPRAAAPECFCSEPIEFPDHPAPKRAVTLTEALRNPVQRTTDHAKRLHSLLPGDRAPKVQSFIPKPQRSRQVLMRLRIQQALLNGSPK